MYRRSTLRLSVSRVPSLLVTACLLTGAAFSPKAFADGTLGGPIGKAPTPSIKLAQTGTGLAGDNPDNQPPAGTPVIPGVDYSNASDQPTGDAAKPPAALGPTPFDLGQIKRVQIGDKLVDAAPLRVGNLDLLVPSVDQMPNLGVTITRADARYIPENLNQPTDRQYFQVNLPKGSPIILSTGQATAWIDLNETTLRSAPLVIGNKIYLPIFSLAPLIGAAPHLSDDGTLVLTPTVQSIEAFPVRGATAITIQTSSPVPDSAIKVSSSNGGGGQPAKVWLDFTGYSMGFDAANTTAQRTVSGPVGVTTGVRAAQPGFFPDVTRVVIDLKKPQQFTVQRLPDPTLLAVVLNDPGATTPPPPTPPPPTISNSLQGWTIVVDAGHGGHDTGARGAKSNEKAHTLDISKRLVRELRKRGATVLMTREDDRYITLQGRVDFANSRRADLFIAVHINASVNKTSRGTETFYYTAPSQGLAREIHKQFAATTGFPNRGISQARFFVIRKTWMPSVLLECGFITTPSEENKMMSLVWRDNVAAAVTQGVVNYAKIYGKG